MIAELAGVEVVVDTAAERLDQRLDLGVLQHPIDTGLLHVEDLPAQREDRLELRVPAALGGAAGRVTLDDVELAALRVGVLAVGELAGQAGAPEQALAPGQVASGAGCDPRPLGVQRLADDRPGLDPVGLEPVLQRRIAHLLDEPLGLAVAELRLGLALELRLRQLHRDDRGQALADVVAGEALVGVLAVGLRGLEQVLVLGVGVDRAGQRRAEALLVGAALVGVDGVGERVDRLVVTGVPLHRELGLDAGALGVQRDDGLVDRILAGVEVLDEVDEPAGVTVGDLEGLLGTLVPQADRQPLVQEGHLLQPAGEGLVLVVGRLEDRVVGPEGDGRTGLPRGGTLGQRRGRTGVLIRLEPGEALPADLHLEPGGQGVHHAHADPVQTAGDRVRLAVELPAGVQRGQDDLDRRALLRRMLTHRDTTAVVGDPDTAVGEQGHTDRVAVAGQRFIHSVVHNLVDEMMKTTLTGGADVHTRTLANRVETLKNLDRTCIVGHAVMSPRPQLRTTREASSESTWRTDQKDAGWPLASAQRPEQLSIEPPYAGVTRTTPVGDPETLRPGRGQPPGRPERPGCPRRPTAGRAVRPGARAAMAQRRRPGTVGGHDARPAVTVHRPRPADAAPCGARAVGPAGPTARPARIPILSSGAGRFSRRCHGGRARRVPATGRAASSARSGPGQ